ncbi:hypothetical protein [Cerasicoccus frondis]|uniref:hypothetical protein n=1 Tax=Cerasicoccus frondis TaxID=490090 RepID=UPI002852B771|nr:hypothetical protein [Cerasicoccus frondis]
MTKAYQRFASTFACRIRKFDLILNRPFVVTFLSGFVLSVLSYKFQSDQYHIDIQVEQRKLEYAKMQDLLTETADKLAIAIPLVADFQKRSFYLREHAGKENPPPFPDKRSYEETRDFYYDTRMKYLESGTYDSVLAEVKAMYESRGVLDQVKVISALFDDMMDPTDMDKLRLDHELLRKEYDKLIYQMGEELRNEKDT